MDYGETRRSHFVYKICVLGKFKKKHLNIILSIKIKAMLTSLLSIKFRVKLIKYLLSKSI